MELSIIILCYRAEDSIVEIVEKAQSITSECCDNYELILVGNYLQGSNDRTGSIVKKLASEDGRIKAVVLPKEGMMGWDIQRGLEACSGKVIGYIDGDGQVPIEGISSCYNFMIESDADLVTTFRITRGDGMIRSIISIIYNTVFSILFPDVKCRDINAKPKVFKRALINQISPKSNDWFIDAEIMIEAYQLGAKVEEIPIEFKSLKGRKSFVGLSAIWEFVVNMIRYKWNRK